MRLLALDLECSGLDVDSCEVYEIGFALYDTKIAKDAPVIMRDFLCIPKEDVTKESEEITGITQNILDIFGVPPEEAFLDLVNIINEYTPEFIVGHNIINYDLPIIKRYLDFLKPHSSINYAPKILDTRIDIVHPRPPKNNSLIYLSAEKGFVNPFSHRALTDAMSCAKLLFSHDIHKSCEAAATPLIEVRADVSFANKDLARVAGYSWDGDRKIWVKKMREAFLAQETKKCPFPVIVLGQGKMPSLK